MSSTGTDRTDPASAGAATDDTSDDTASADTASSDSTASVDTASDSGRTGPSWKLRLAVGAMFLTLASIPVIVLIGGSPRASHSYPVMSEIPAEGSGGYLDVTSPSTGYVKLFVWLSPPDEVPAESPTLSHNAVRGVTIVHRGIEELSHYLVFKVGTPEPLAVTATTSGTRTVHLRFEHTLAPGSYLVDVPSSSIFGGREYYYFRIKE